MPGLRGDMRHDAVIERLAVERMQDCGGRGAGEAIEDDRDASHARGEHRAGDGSQLVAAQTPRQVVTLSRGPPASSMVATSGAAGERRSAVTP